MARLLKLKPVRRVSTRQPHAAGRDTIVGDIPHTAVSLARRLDREADCELQHGHIARAEMLAFRAAALRGLA